ncbi:MAG: amidohydrolase family protein [Chitinophagaceae bacterium]
MVYKKFRADRLFDGYRFATDSSVLIMKEDATVEAVISSADAGDDVQEFEGILSPGFINCHCHLELSHMKGMIPEKTGLVPFVSKVMQHRHIAEEEILNAIRLAEDEMISNGIVAVGDICNNAMTIPQKTTGRIRYHNFIEASGFLPEVSEQRFERAVAIFREYAKHYAIPAEANSIVPHAPYSVSRELWQKIIQFPGNHLMTIHNQESPEEDELFLYKKGAFLKLYESMGIDISFFQSSGKSSLQTYLPLFLSNQPLILVHNVHSTREDLLFSKTGHSQVWWCLCPNANLYITGNLPDITMIRQGTESIVLGTDSLASNHQLSILAEIRTILQHLPSLPLEDLLRWGTSNGAKALQIGNLLGSFEGGKQPGVSLISHDLSGSRRLM